MKLAYVDIETTGLDSDLHDVWEVAVVLDNDDDQDTCTSYRWTFQPDLRMADSAALRVNRFYDRVDDLPRESDIARFWLDGSELNQPTLREALAHLAEVTAGAHLVGCNPAFDALRIERLMRAYNIAPAWHYHLVDVEVLTIGYLAGRGRWPALTKVGVFGSGWKSTDLAEALGIEPDPMAHAALNDALFARRLYHSVMTLTHGAVA